MPIQIARIENGAAVEWQVRDVAADGSHVLVAGGLPDREHAIAALTPMLAPTGALTAAIDAEGPTGVAVFVEGEEARDSGGWSRVLDPGSVNFDRPMPLPLMATTTTSWGHEGAELVGVITEATVASPNIEMRVRFAISDEAARIVGLMRDGILTRHSPDMGAEDTDFVCSEYDVDDWGEYCVSGVLHFTKATVLGTTILPFAALDSAVITLDETETVDGETESDGDALAAAGSLVAAASAAAPVQVPAPASVARPEAGRVFPTEWFSNPGLTAPTTPTVTPEGRVFGHIACWDTCHISHLPTCLTPPHSATEYAHFHTGGHVELEGGERVRVGHLTLGTTHAAERGLTAHAAAQHYENTGAAVADVRVGEDEWGIWFAGALRPGVDDWSVWALEVSALSGDWRVFEPSGGLELCAALAVNVPGFPIPDVASVTASGECVALVAAGVRTMALVASAQRPTRPPMPPVPQSIDVEARLQAMEAHINQLRAITAPLAPIATERLMTRLSNNSKPRGR